MKTQEEEFLAQLRATFRAEGEEQVHAISSNLEKLRHAKSDDTAANLVETIFRDIHSLKGAARSVDFTNIEVLCQELEGIFAMLKKKVLALSPELFALFTASVDMLALLSAVQEREPPPALRKRSRKLALELRAIVETRQRSASMIGARPPDPAIADDPPGAHHDGSDDASRLHLDDASAEDGEDDPAVADAPLDMEAVRLRVDRIDPLFFQAEEMVQTKIAVAHRIDELREIGDLIDAWTQEMAPYRYSASNGVVGAGPEFVQRQAEWLNRIAERTARTTRALTADHRLFSRMVDEHIETSRDVLLLPVASFVQGLPRFMRDLARAQGKEVNFVVHGRELEIEKQTLDALKDPLLHLLRNCVDHGVGTPGTRVRAGKPARASVRLHFSVTDHRSFRIVLTDDGSGIDPAEVRRVGSAIGMLTEEEARSLTDREALECIFRSGFSTSPIVTDISGRGLGLAIVRERVGALGGTVSVESHPNAGTTFTLDLPLKRTAFRGVMVRVGSQMFILPTTNVEFVAEMGHGELESVENTETVTLKGRRYCVAHLGRTLGIPDETAPHFATNGAAANKIRLLVIAQGSDRMAFVVDEIVDERQVLVKDLGRHLSHVNNIAGATTLGSGRVVCVLHVADLLKSALRAGRRKPEAVHTGSADEPVRRLLVADDSITSRSLLKGILETSGYEVETAVDGIDAFTKVQTGNFDLLVSDVDMPEMNGFELTATIRKDARFAELPIVLVTALDTNEDRAKGIKAGASAYIIKSSFDKSNLLDIVRRLL